MQKIESDLHTIVGPWEVFKKEQKAAKKAGLGKEARDHFALMTALASLDLTPVDPLDVQVNDVIGELSAKVRELQEIIRAKDLELARQSEILRDVTWIQGAKPPRMDVSPPMSVKQVVEHTAEGVLVRAFLGGDS